MFKANNRKVLLAVSVVLFLLCSSVNLVPVRSFLESITYNSNFCFKYYPCEGDSDCYELGIYECNSKLIFSIFINLLKNNKFFTWY